MNPVCQNPDQKATPKKSKIHRSAPEISRKVIAFGEILIANKIKSAREIAKLLNVSNSTMQTWKEKDNIEPGLDDEVSLFFRTPAGVLFLNRIVIAIMYNNKCGKSGICGVQECLHNSGLDKHVASSVGALQKFWQRCEVCILNFGKNWEQKLAQGMQNRKITVILDEMFRKKMPCLVAIEALSNYILLEKFTEDRSAATWKKELDAAIEIFPVKIGQICSDLCGAIRSVAKSYEALHSSDLFHGQYEISKATGGGLSSQERASEKALNEAEDHLEKIRNKPIRIAVKEKKQQKQEKKEAEKKCAFLTVDYEEKKERREKTQEAKRELGKIYHPIDLKTGKIQSASIVKKKFSSQFKKIRNSAEEAGLSFQCHEQFFLVLAALLLDMQLPKAQKKFFKEVIFPLSYLKMIWKRFSKKEKEQHAQLLKSLQEKLKNAFFPEEIKEALMRRGKEIVGLFQRSSSCVEGRNGVLSLLMHRFHYLSEKTLRVLSIVPNFGVKRKEDGTTAAERFFGGKHDELFSCLAKNVKIPGKPQLQIRGTKREAA
jgi:hypothetical protein